MSYLANYCLYLKKRVKRKQLKKRFTRNENVKGFSLFLNVKTVKKRGVQAMFSNDSF